MKFNNKKKTLTISNLNKVQNLELSKDFLNENYVNKINLKEDILKEKTEEFLSLKKQQLVQTRHNTPFGNFENDTHARTFEIFIHKINYIFEKRILKIKNIYKFTQKNLTTIIDKKILLLKIKILHFLKIKKKILLNSKKVNELFKIKKINIILLLKERIVALSNILLFNTKNYRKYLNYLNPNILRIFLNEYGEINSSLNTFLKNKMQKRLALGVKQARMLNYLPFVYNYIN